MAKYKGIDASVKIGATAVLEMASWTVDEKAEVAGEDALAFGERRSSGLVVTKLTASGSAEGFSDPGDTTGQTALRTAYLAGTKVSGLRLYETGAKYYTVDCYITSFSVAVTREGFNKITFAFTGEGVPGRV